MKGVVAMSASGRSSSQPETILVNARGSRSPNVGLSTSEQRRIWILGLNHSGTTILWRSFRKDGQFLCFDEPLTGDIGNCFPVNNAKKTFDEYLRLFSSTPEKFWDIYEPIEPLQELDESFTVEQSRYLQFLLEQPQHVVIDETHVHHHLAAVAALSRNAYLIHLYRRASAFVTSHLRPIQSGRTTIFRDSLRWLRSKYNVGVFWTRRDFLPGMLRGEVMGRHPASKFGLMLTKAGYDSRRIMAAPTIVRLLAYWHYQYHYLEHEGPRLFGERFFSLPYETFANDATGAMRKLYEWIGLRPPADIQYSDVYSPKPPHRAGDKRWSEAARIAGFSDEEIEALL